MQENTNSPEEQSTTPQPTVIAPKGVRYTVDGEAIEYTDGTVRYPPVVELQVVPEGWKPQHHDGMIRILEFLKSMRQYVPKRQLPALRTEIVDCGVSKQIIKALEEFGFVQMRLIAVNDMARGGKSVGARAVVYFTPAGKGYFKYLHEQREKANVAT